jgi:hypothetical protein
VGNLRRDLPRQLDYVAWVLIQFATGRENLDAQLMYGGKPLLSLSDLLLSLTLIGFLLVVQLCQRRRPLMDVLSRQPLWIRWPVYYAGIMVIGFLGAYHSAREFIYFQF